MEYIIIGIIALLGAGLTLFSGFGLGTLLLPVFGLFFSIDIAIALTAIVHFSNNIIKFFFYYKYINKEIIIWFGVPSIIASFLGAYLLQALIDLKPILSYSIGNTVFIITPIKSVIALLLLFFSLIELVPQLSKIEFHKKYLPLGGLLSGFFGGLSGNQGALRSAFLIRAGLTKEMFIGTGVVIACFVDITRLSIYYKNIVTHVDTSNILLLCVAVLSAFIGVFIGNKLVKKITIRLLQIIVAIVIFLFSILLGLGIL